MPSRGALTYASDGRLITTNAGGAINCQFFGGMALRNTDGALRMFDIGATPVLTNDASAVAIGGFWFRQAGGPTTSGILYATTQAVAASDVYIAGARLRSDGALRVVVASPSAGDPTIGGWTFKQSTGQLYIQQIA